MAEKEDMEPETIAGLFNEVAYEVVSEEQTPAIGEERLEQLRVMVQSMRKLYPQASNYNRTLLEIDKQMGIR